MPDSCAVPSCKGNYKTGPRVSIYSFPREEPNKAAWIAAVGRRNFVPTKYSKVCELHFEPDQIVREASAYDPRTGRTLTAPLSVPRLRKGAVPTLFMPPAGALVKHREGSSKITKSKKKQPKEVIANDEAEKTQSSELAKMLREEPATLNDAEPSIFIKSEPVWQHEDPPPDIECVQTAEELTSTSRSPPCILQTVPIGAKPDSTNVDNNPTPPVPDIPARKRKIDDSKSPASDATQNMTRIKIHHYTMPSSSSKDTRLVSSSGTSKKSKRRSVPLKKDATREMLQTLVNRPEDEHSSRSSERPGDLFDVFADFIAEKLREMNWNNCAYALRSILDVVFQAGKTQCDSEDDSSVCSPSPASSSSSSGED